MRNDMLIANKIMLLRKICVVLICFVAMACTDQGEFRFNDFGNIGFARKPSESDFDFMFRTIIEPKCIACHSGSKVPHGIDLSSYDSIINAPVFPPLVARTKPLDSSLYLSVAEGRMPKRSAKLSSEEIELIKKWILEGARRKDSEPIPPQKPTPEPQPAPPCVRATPQPGEPPEDNPCESTPGDPSEPPDEWE